MAKSRLSTGAKTAQTSAESQSNDKPTLQEWPKRPKARLTYALAKRFCELLSTSENSLLGLLQSHPELPSHSQLVGWRIKKPWFAEAWKIAREAQAEFLAQRCLDIASEARPENAHAQRLRFDIYRTCAKWFAPAIFGERIQSAPNVNVGIAINGQALEQIRGRLSQTREALLRDKADTKAEEPTETGTTKALRLQDKAPTSQTSRLNPSSLRACA